MTTTHTAEISEEFRRIVARRLGLQFDDAKLTYLREVLQRRSTATRQPPDVYLGRLASEAAREELTYLATELTVGETHFFRNIDQFHAFTERALPERARVRPIPRSLRVLSAGCASGEEPFSLAILVRQAMAGSVSNVSILAVDINPAALQRAARGRFSRWALRETPPEIEHAWFRHEGDEVVLHESVRAAVQFEQRNLAVEDFELWPPDTYDIVFCRNVLMYFTPDQARSLVARIARALAPGGYLFLGHAETLRGLSHEFQLCHTHGTFYYTHKEGAGTQPLVCARSETGEGVETWAEAIHRAATRIEALTRNRDQPLAASTSRSSVAPPSNVGPARDLLRQERFVEALDALRRLPAESKGDPDALLLEALLLADRGELAAAEQVCRRLLVVDELNAGAHYVLALCREGVGDRHGAADQYQVATDLDPFFAMPRLHLGLLARRTGNFEAARRELGQAIVLLQREDASRLLFFGGGFTRETLSALCRAELDACGGPS